MIYVRRRADLREQGILITLKFNGHQALDDWTPAFQPDELDNSEFNLVLLKKESAFEVYDIAIAIDFDFNEACEICQAVAVDYKYGTHLCEQCLIDQNALK